MSDSPRWHLDGLPGTTGIVEVMLYDDHVAAVAAARADERERAAERVEALPVRQLDYWEVVARGHVLAAIDGVEKP